MTDGILLLTVDYTLHPVEGEPGMLWIDIHSSEKEDINHFGREIHDLLCKQLRDYPDDKFAPIKSKMLELLPQPGHFEMGRWVE